MCTVKVYDIIQGNDYPTAGSKLFDLMVVARNKRERLIVDMTNVSSLPSLFLNTSIGQYLKTFGKDSLKGQISFTQITKSQAERIKDYISKLQ